MPRISRSPETASFRSPGLGLLGLQPLAGELQAEPIADTGDLGPDVAAHLDGAGARAAQLAQWQEALELAERHDEAAVRALQHLACVGGAFRERTGDLRAHGRSALAELHADVAVLALAHAQHLELQGLADLDARERLVARLARGARQLAHVDEAVHARADAADDRGDHADVERLHDGRVDGLTRLQLAEHDIVVPPLRERDLAALAVALDLDHLDLDSVALGELRETAATAGEAAAAHAADVQQAVAVRALELHLDAEVELEGDDASEPIRHPNISGLRHSETSSWGYAWTAREEFAARLQAVLG